MAKFQKGDKVLVNGNLVATIQTYSEANNIVTYVSTPPGGGTDTATGHISQTRIEHLVSERVVVPVEEEEAVHAEAAVLDSLHADEITGSASL